MPEWRVVGAAFVGGSLGTVGRTLLVLGLPAGVGGWPWATFIANIVGSGLLGWWATWLEHRPAPVYVRPLLCTGVCGGLTTFSTLQVELLGMLDVGAYRLLAGYLAASLAGGLLVAHLASVLVRRAVRA